MGAWLKHRGSRDKIVLATKALPPYGARLQETVENSLRRLQTDVIDLYQLHAWDGKTPLEDTFAELTKLVDQGKVRYVGCSNFAAWQLCKALWKADVGGAGRLESIQPNYNLVIRDIEKELLPLCADQEIGVITYSPLGAGFLTGKHRRDEAPPDGSRFAMMPGHQPIYYHETGWRVMEGLRSVVEETGHSMSDLALAWVIGQPGVTSVLVGARKIEQVDQAFAAEQMGLTSELRERLNTL